MIMIFGAREINDDISSFFFILFEILIFWAVRGEKGKKLSKMKNRNIQHTPHLRNIIAYDHDFLFNCKHTSYDRAFCYISLKL